MVRWNLSTSPLVCGRYGRVRFGAILSASQAVGANRYVDRRGLSCPRSSVLDVGAGKKLDKVAEWVKDVESTGIFFAADLGAKRSLRVCPVVGFAVHE